MKQDGQWWSLGGTFDAGTADARVSQFAAACTHSNGQSRQFRVIAIGGETAPWRRKRGRST